MRKFILLTFFVFCFCFSAFADNTDVQSIEVAPLSGSISFSSVTLSGTSWVTAPTVELRGRKAVNILNTSTTESIYLASASPSTITRRLYSQDNVTFAASSDLHIYLSGNTAGVVAEITEIK